MVERGEQSPLVVLSCADHHERLVSGLWNFFESQYAVDFDFNCRSSSSSSGHWGAIRAHRLMLEVFLSPDKLLRRTPTDDILRSEQHKGNDPQLTVNEHDHLALGSMLEFLYKGRVAVREEQLDHLLDLAKRLDFQLLAATVEKEVADRSAGGQAGLLDTPLGGTTTNAASQFDSGTQPSWNLKVAHTFSKPKDKIMSNIEEAYGVECTPVHLVSTSVDTESSDTAANSAASAGDNLYPQAESCALISQRTSGSDCYQSGGRDSGVRKEAGCAGVTTNSSSRTEMPSEGSAAAPLEFIKSLHGNDLLVYSGYLFSKERLFGEKVFWSCVESKRYKCPGRCHTTDDRVTKFTDNHNHVPDAGKIGARRVMDRVKQQALHSGERIDQVIHDATSDISQTFSAHLPSISLMRRTLQRARQMNSGLGRETMRNPVSLRDLRLPRDFQETTSGEPFLLFDSGSGDDRLLLFATQASLQLLSRCEHWYCDGTFRSAPPLFSHLFTLHGVHQPHLIPCAFALLPDRTQASFGRLFATLSRLQPNIRPTSIITGFDVAANNALGLAYPGASLRSCFFHMSQCIWRQIQSIEDMSARYSSDPDFALQVRLLTALAYVPEAHVVEAFEALKVTPFYLRERRTLQPLLDYFEDTWVGRVDTRTPPLFLPKIWNCFECIGQGQVINCAIEAWHRGFDKLVRAGRLNIWKFMSGLKQEQARNQTRIEQLLAGQEDVEPRKKYRDGTKHIVKVMEEYGRRHLIDYLTGIATNLSLSV